MLLTDEPSLVAPASALLAAVLAHNEGAMRRLHATGAFFFALMYSGADARAPARLLAAAHLRQHFRGAGDADAEAAAALPLGRRSYLGQLLPESLLHVLETSGPERFAGAAPRARPVQPAPPPPPLSAARLFDPLHI